MMVDLFAVNPQGIEILKPTPCHYVAKIERGDNVLKVYLDYPKGKICAQVLTKEKIKINVCPSKVEVYLGDRLWREEAAKCSP